MHNQEGDRPGKLCDITLTDGPPWGFTLAGGSEFGSRLYVKKVTTNEKTGNLDQLQSGDEILSVNGISCTSRANAIQMVRSIEHELRLKIFRWSEYITKEQPSLNECEPSSNMYNNMVENMNDLSKSSSYAMKRDLMQQIHTDNGNYKILSINKSHASNEHNIRIGIPPTEQANTRPPSYQESQSRPTPYNNNTQQKQRVTVKMVPGAQPGSKILTGHATTHSAHSSRLVYPDQADNGLDQTDNVEEESVKSVSAAKAMFENLSSTNDTTKKAKPHMKNWTSGSAIERRHDLNTEQPPKATSSSNLHAPTSRSHQHSRSLPIEMAGKEFEKAVAAYKQYRNTDTKNNNDNKIIERPKSAHYYSDDSPEPPAVPQRYSQSELLKPLRNKSFDHQSSSSSSTEELRDSRLRNVQPGQNDSANELRQAANRYHQELMKNYPKFRHSIANVDNTAKFSRKVSMPTQDAFARGEPYRATIATTTARMPRSKSTNDTLDDNNVQELLNKSSDNSMMSRLLRDKNLVKVDEEPVSPTKKFSSHLIRSSTVPEPQHRVETKHENEINTNTIEKSLEDTHIPENEMVTKPSETINLQPKDVSSQLHTVSTESWSHTTNIVETDIDSEEAERIIHQKAPSTDSAVYMMHETTEISHTKALSNESTDSMKELSEINNLSNHPERNDFENCEYLPPPPVELLHDEDNDDDEDNEDDDEDDEHIENKKPERTINRKKKDSHALSSRNNSCVSTDSTTSTTTVDSGIVMRSESSPRTSPHLSTSQYYAGSRETLDGDVEELNNDEPHATSTPERHEQTHRLIRQNSVEQVTSDDQTNIANHSRQESEEIICSPKIDDLDGEKTKLMDSMREKINELREQEQEISDEIKMNEELGKKVLNMVEAKATQSEFSKFELFIGELNKIVALLLSLTQRLHRYELMLQDLDMSNEADKIKKDSLISKIDKLKSQHEEACYLRDVNDKRGDNVATFLEKYCSEEEFADFQYYVDMKSQLALMQSEIREKVKLGEERLKALQSTGSEWGFG